MNSNYDLLKAWTNIKLPSKYILEENYRVYMYIQLTCYNMQEQPSFRKEIEREREKRIQRNGNETKVYLNCYNVHVSIQKYKDMLFKNTTSLDE